MDVKTPQQVTKENKLFKFNNTKDEGYVYMFSSLTFKKWSKIDNKKVMAEEWIKVRNKQKAISIFNKHKNRKVTQKDRELNYANL